MSGRAQVIKSAILILVSVISWASLLVGIARRRRQGYAQPMQPPRLEDLVAVGASEQVAAHLAAGRKIAAIKAYKDETGAGLTNAKRAIDGLMSRARATEMLADGVSERVASLVAHGDVIGAIKAYREETGARPRSIQTRCASANEAEAVPPDCAT